MPTDGADLAAIRERHQPCDCGHGTPHCKVMVCQSEKYDWPCEQGILLAELARLGEALEAARNGLQEIREMASRHDPKKNWAFPAAMPIEAIAQAALKASE